MSLKSFKRVSKLIAVTLAVFTTTGCVSWYKLHPDGLEAPEANIKEAKAIYEKRLNFRKKAYFVGQKTTRHYFTHTWFHRYVTTVSAESAFTQRLGVELQNKFGSLKDLELVGLHRDVIDEQSFGTDTGSMLNGTLPKQADYLILYKVTNVAVRESLATQTGRFVTGVVGTGLSMGGKHRAAYNTQRSGDMVRLYYATVSAQVQMVDTKNGKSIFSFNISADSIPSPFCAQDNIDDCIRKLADKACARYLYQFGPPIYVKESRGYGKMVELNVGADYGVVPGMNFRFIQKNAAGQEFEITTGYVGHDPDDIGPNYCRVFVHGQGSPENFRVMKNVLAKPIMMR